MVQRSHGIEPTLRRDHRWYLSKGFSEIRLYSQILYHRNPFPLHISQHFKKSFIVHFQLHRHDKIMNEWIHFKADSLLNVINFVKPKCPYCCCRKEKHIPPFLSIFIFLHHFNTPAVSYGIWNMFDDLTNSNAHKSLRIQPLYINVDWNVRAVLP